MILPVASLVFRAFVRFVRADERMPRMSGVVKNEGEYEFQMAAIASHRPVRGWVLVKFLGSTDSYGRAVREIA